MNQNLFMELAIEKHRSNVIMDAYRNISLNLKNTLKKITICDPNRNGYSKTDYSATFIRNKTSTSRNFSGFYWS